MTLRTRLAVALAALAALSVVAVASISYAATSQRLYGEVDDALVSAALDLGGPGGERLAGFCEELLEVPLRYGPEGPLAGLRGEIVQCIDAGGRVVAARGPVGVPVEQPGEDVTDRPGAPATTVGGHGPPPRPRPWTQRLGGQPYRVVAVPLAGGGEVRIGRSLAETNRVLGSVRSRSILVGLAIMVLAAAAGVLIARRTTRPVTRLTDAAEEIAASGRLDIAVPASTRDGRNEIGRLARAFSSMLASLTRSRDQQQRLVQDAGHELRTPLTSLRANIDTLRRYPDLDPAPRAGVLADLDSELRELSALVDELVALAVDRYDDEPEQTVALDELAERAADRTRRRSGRNVTVDAEPAPVLGKPQLLLRAVGNLLDNAVKFSPERSPIEVTVRAGGNGGGDVRGGRLAVRDHGPGIAEEDLPNVFDRFYRALDARSLPGSGLGLAIVRKIVEDGGGSVWAANHPGGGAVLTIQLPPVPAAGDS